MRSVNRRTTMENGRDYEHRPVPAWGDAQYLHNDVGARDSDVEFLAFNPPTAEAGGWERCTNSRPGTASRLMTHGHRGSGSVQARRPSWRSTPTAS